MAVNDRIAPHPLPADSLLQRYSRDGSYADCYVAELARPITYAEYVEAFYTTWAFKSERFILKWIVSRPSTDRQARELALGTRERFAAWTVEARAPNQIVMCDYMGKTRSWLMVESLRDGAATRLYFGTAVVAHTDARGRRSIGGGFHVLMGFHKLYSRVLLSAARNKLRRPPPR
jgi:hypothetical protein